MASRAIQQLPFTSETRQNITHFEVANPRGWLGYEQLPRGIHLLSFYLPNARTLSLESFASHRKGTNSALADTDPFWPLSPAPQATFLTTLHLDHCSSNTHNIAAMLAQTPNLKTLFYACYLPAFECDFEVDELRRGLEHIRNTLTKLTLNLTIMQRGLIDISDHEWPLTHGRIDDLRDFLSLTDLEIPLAFLHGHTAPENWQPLADLLPPNVISFTVNDELMNHDAFSDPLHSNSDPRYDANIPQPGLQVIYTEFTPRILPSPLRRLGLSETLGRPQEGILQGLEACR